MTSGSGGVLVTRASRWVTATDVTGRCDRRQPALGSRRAHGCLARRGGTRVGVLPPMDDVAAAFDPQLMFDFPDPYPMFAEMRRTQPVAHFTMLGRENYVVTRYDDVWAVLRDGDTYSSRANYEVGRFFGRTIIEMDGKEHTRTRSLVSAVFSARAIDALEPTITRLVHERIDTFAGAGRADLVAELTTIFPVQVIAHIVGVPPSNYARFMRWSLDLIAFSKDPQKGRPPSSSSRDRRRARPRSPAYPSRRRRSSRP